MIPLNIFSTTIFHIVTKRFVCIREQGTKNKKKKNENLETDYKFAGKTTGGKVEI